MFRREINFLQKLTHRLHHLNVRLVPMMRSAEYTLLTHQDHLHPTRPALHKFRTQRLQKVLDLPPVDVPVDRRLE